MIIQCDNCKAKYKLSEDKIAGKGARVKCRKCSDYIIVMKPEYEHLKSEFVDGIRAEELRRAAEEEEETRKAEEEEREVQTPVEPPAARYDAPEEEREVQTPVEPPAARYDVPEDEREVQTPVEPPVARYDVPEEEREEVEDEPSPEERAEEEEDKPFTEERAEEDIASMKAQEEDLEEREELPEEAYKEEAVVQPPREDDEEKREVAIEAEEPVTSEVTDQEEETPKDDIDLAFERFLGSLREDPKMPEDSFDQPDIAAGPEDEPTTGEDHQVVVAPSTEPEEIAEEKPEILSAGDTLEFLSKDAEQEESHEPYDLKLQEEKLDFQSGFDLSESIRSEPEETAETPPAEERPEGVIDPRKEPPSDTLKLDTDTPDAGDAAKEQRLADMRFEISEPAPREKEAPYEYVPKTIVKTRKRSKLAGFLMALLVFLLAVAGAGAYLAFTEPGNELIIKYAPRVRSLFGREGGLASSQYDIANLIGYYETNRKTGKIFVIKGDVVNLSNTVASGIVVKGQLLGDRNSVLEEKKVYAGNPIEGKILKNASKSSIEEKLQNKLGKNLSNIDIQPGSSVPFMVVFFDLPEKIEAYKVESVD